MNALLPVKRFWDDNDEGGCDNDGPNKEVTEKALKKLKRKGEKKRREEELDQVVVESPDKLAGKEEEEREPRKRRRGKKRKKPLDPEFTPLSNGRSTTNDDVRRVLPRWLAQPTPVVSDLANRLLPVDEMPGLRASFVERLKANGITSFFPVQSAVIPHLLDSSSRWFRPPDVCVSAPTGSGKTLAFVVPLVQALSNRTVPRIRAVVVLPVQDLATQVARVFQTYVEGSDLRVKLLTPTVSLSTEQGDLVRRGASGAFHSLCDIVVATPGRLVDHVQKTEGFDLTNLRYLVIDEADRVLESVQNDWLRLVEKAVYSSWRKRPGPLNVERVRCCELPLQKLLFSATLSHDPEQLQQLQLFEPKLFASRSGTPKSLKETLVLCTDSLKKPQVLYSLIQSRKMKKALVFTKSVEHTHNLALLLKHYGLRVGELSSQIKGKRRRVLNQFSNGSIDLLVASDALARGIDIGCIDFVVSYDCPQFAKTYIHRVGRTARAGQVGEAITICDAKEARGLKEILKAETLKEGLEETQVPDEELDADLYEQAARKAGEVIEQEQRSK